jgi:hypothetical protein
VILPNFPRQEITSHCWFDSSPDHVNNQDNLFKYMPQTQLLAYKETIQRNIYTSYKLIDYVWTMFSMREPLTKKVFNEMTRRYQLNETLRDVLAEVEEELSYRANLRSTESFFSNVYKRVNT